MTAAKHQVWNIAIEIGAVILVEGALAWVSLGTSAGVAAARAAMLVARSMAIAAELSGTVATIVSLALAGAAYGALAAFLAGLIAQAGELWLTNGDAITVQETMTRTAVWAVAGGVAGPVAAGAATALRSVGWAPRYGDDALAGNPPVPATPAQSQPLWVLEQRHGRSFVHVDSPDHMFTLLEDAGKGAGLIVVRGAKRGFVSGRIFKGRNDGNGNLTFVDAQTGRPIGWWEAQTPYKILWTHRP